MRYHESPPHMCKKYTNKSSSKAQSYMEAFYVMFEYFCGSTEFSLRHAR